MTIFVLAGGVVIIVLIIIVYCTMQKYKGIIFSSKENIDKLTDQYLLLNHWLEAKNYGKSASEYFESEGYGHIAIYGMAELANRLMEDLKDSKVLVDYGIDRDASCSIARITDVYSLKDKLPAVDVVVVTPIYAYPAIKKELENKISCPIISLEEVIWSI